MARFGDDATFCICTIMHHNATSYRSFYRIIVLLDKYCRRRWLRWDFAWCMGGVLHRGLRGSGELNGLAAVGSSATRGTLDGVQARGGGGWVAVGWNV